MKQRVTVLLWVMIVLSTVAALEERRAVREYGIGGISGVRKALRERLGTPRAGAGDRVKRMEPSGDSIRRRSLEEYISQAESDPERAIDIISRGIEEHPENRTGYAVRGAYYIRNDQLERALKDYSRIIVMDDEDIGGYKGRAMVNYKLGRMAQAAEDLERIVELVPGNMEMLHSLGMIYDRMGEYEGALTVYNRILDKDNQDYSTLNMRGIVNFRLGRAGEAVRDFGRIIEAHPELGVGYNNRGEVYIMTGEYEKALEDLVRCIDAEGPGYEYQIDCRRADYEGFTAYMRGLDERSGSEERILQIFQGLEGVTIID